MRKTIFLLLVALELTAGTTAKEWLREVEIKSEPAKNGAEMHYTVRIMPDKTVKYDRIVFEVIYHQEFPWTDSRGRKSTKIHEPVTFLYRRNNISLVDDLELYMGINAMEAPHSVSQALLKSALVQAKEQGHLQAVNDEAFAGLLEDVEAMAEPDFAQVLDATRRAAPEA